MTSIQNLIKFWSNQETPSPVSDRQTKIQYYNNLIDEFLKLKEPFEFRRCHYNENDNMDLYLIDRIRNNDIKYDIDEFIENRLSKPQTLNNYLKNLQDIIRKSKLPIFENDNLHNSHLSEKDSFKILEIAVIYISTPHIKEAHKIFFNKLKLLIAKYIDAKNTIMDKEIFLDSLKHMQNNLFCYSKFDGVEELRGVPYFRATRILNADFISKKKYERFLLKGG